MFDLSRRAELEERFSRLEFTWYPTLLEIIPQWGNPRYLAQFHIHTTFLNNSQVESLLEIMEDTFSQMWDKGVIDRVVALNDKTSESADFIKALLNTNLDSEYKLLLAISGVLSVKFLGLRQSLVLLKMKNKQFGKVKFDRAVFSDEDLKNKDLVILPGVNHQFTSFRSVSSDEISHFFESGIGLQLSLFLTQNKTTFGEFFSHFPRKLIRHDAREFSTSDLVMVLRIVENSPREILNKLTAPQILSIVKEMQQDPFELYPMNEILKRPRRDDVEYEKSPDFTSLFILRQFTEDFELESLINDAISFDLQTRLTNIPALLSPSRHYDPMTHKRNAPILSVLAEIAVSKGVYRYVEVIESLDELVVERLKWHTIETPIKIRLIKIIREALDESNDEINFRWLLELKGHLPLFDYRESD